MSRPTNARGAPSRRDLIQGATATASATALRFSREVFFQAAPNSVAPANMR